MIEVELDVPAGATGEEVVRVIEQVFTAHDLACVLKGTLARYPGCIHWHFRKGKQRGTLEITWWGIQNRLWFKIARGRIGDWIDESLPELKKEIESSL